MNINTKFEFDNVLSWLYFQNNNWKVCRWPTKCINIIIKPTTDDSILYEFIDEFDKEVLIPEKDVFIDIGLAHVECKKRNNKNNEIMVDNNIIKVGEKYKCKTDEKN